MRFFYGFDPGQKGGVACVSDTGDLVWVAAMPSCATALADMMRVFRVSDPCFVERQQAFPKQGGASNFTTGEGYGTILGVLAALEYPTHIIRSKDWQAVVLRGEKRLPGKEGKEQSVACAERLWPATAFRGPRGGLLDGLAEAALIAEYGRRLMGGA